MNVIKGSQYIIGVILPDSLTAIGGSAFFNCTGLTSVTIGSGVTAIGNGAFSGCRELTSVTFDGSISPANFSSIGNFPEDLRDKYLADGVGTYTRPNGGGTWTKQ